MLLPRTKQFFTPDEVRLRCGSVDDDDDDDDDL